MHIVQKWFFSGSITLCHKRWYFFGFETSSEDIVGARDSLSTCMTGPTDLYKEVQLWFHKSFINVKRVCIIYMYLFVDVIFWFSWVE